MEKTCDGVQVGGVFGQEEEPGPGLADGLADQLAAVAAQIVHDHDVAGLKGGDQEGAHPGQEDLAVDRAIEQAGRIDPVAPEGGDEGQGLPAAERGLGLEAGAARAPAAQGRHVGLGPGLIDEHQAISVDAPLILAPLLTSAGHVRPILLLGQQAFF